MIWDLQVRLSWGQKWYIMSLIHVLILIEVIRWHFSVIHNMSRDYQVSESRCQSESQDKTLFPLHSACSSLPAIDEAVHTLLKISLCIRIEQLLPGPDSITYIQSESQLATRSLISLITYTYLMWNSLWQTYRTNLPDHLPQGYYSRSDLHL